MAIEEREWGIQKRRQWGIKLPLTRTPMRLRQSKSVKKCVSKDISPCLRIPISTIAGRAAEALGDEGDETAVEPLLEALKDPFVDVQWLAAKSLGKLGDSPCS